MSAATHNKRLYFLDTLRVLAILVVFFFHCARFFDADDWHVKNGKTALGATLFITGVSVWIMPLFFFISGGSTWFALQKKKSLQFIADRTKRIFVPLVFGCLVLALPQVYLERLSHGAYQGSLLQFVPRYFDGLYAFGGNFAWMGLHLWYLFWMFVFSLLLLPVFLLFKKYFLPSKAGTLLHGSIAFILLPLLTILPGILLPTGHFIGWRVWGGWNIIEHLLFLLAGFVALSYDGFIRTCQKLKWLFLAVSLLSVAMLLYWFLTVQSATAGSVFYDVKVAVRSLACWMMIFAALGLSATYANVTGKRWQYCSEAVLPFYILHQTVIVILGYFIVQWQMPVFSKYAAIAGLSFVSIALVYEGLVRRTRPTRWLFGMPPAKKNGSFSGKQTAASHGAPAALLKQSAATNKQRRFVAKNDWLNIEKKL